MRTSCLWPIFTEHRVSEDEFLADESGSSQEDSDEETTDEEMDDDVEEMTGLRISIEGKM